MPNVIWERGAVGRPQAVWPACRLWKRVRALFRGGFPAELRKANTIGDAIMLGWLEFFQREAGKAR